MRDAPVDQCVLAWTWQRAVCVVRWSGGGMETMQLLAGLQRQARVLRTAVGLQRTLRGFGARLCSACAQNYAFFRRLKYTDWLYCRRCTGLAVARLSFSTFCIYLAPPPPVPICPHPTAPLPCGCADANRAKNRQRSGVRGRDSLHAALC